MTPEQFVYWLQGFVEVNEGELENGHITPKQWQMITDHLKEVFRKETPNYTLYPPIIPMQPMPPSGIGQYIC